LSEFAQFKRWLKQTEFLTDADCDLFVRDLRIETFASKQYFLEEGRVCQKLGFINAGNFRTYYLLDGKEINTHFALQDQFVTDFKSFLTGQPSRYFIEAIDPAEIVVFNSAVLQAAYAQSPRWEKFGRLMAEAAFRESMQRTEAFLFYNAEERYRLLLEHRPDILQTIPLQYIASYLGIEKESLSRIRKKIASVDAN
jgi:CRP/FNR family transcriptional regulator